MVVDMAGQSDGEESPQRFRRRGGEATVRGEFDLTVPSSARVYDAMLGGKDNFAVDRDVVIQMIKAVPDVLQGPRTIRAGLKRAVRYMATEAGIDQFIDLGSGLPTQENVHQVTQRYRPGARVVYVDNDPVVVVHGRALLATDESTAVVTADFRDVEGVLHHPDVRRLIDFNRPVGLIMCSVLHYVPDKEHPMELVAAYSEALSPGSHLFITHVCLTGHPGSGKMEEIFRENFEGQLRTRQQVQEFFTGWELIEPGVLPIVLWRPDGAAPYDLADVPLSQHGLIGGLGRK
jgi:hypothetical protein